jgi:hypothetical protein
MVRLGTLPRMTMPIPLSASRDLHGRNMLPDGCHPGCERDHTIRAMQLLGARLAVQWRAVSVVSHRTRDNLPYLSCIRALQSWRMLSKRAPTAEAVSRTIAALEKTHREDDPELVEKNSLRRNMGNNCGSLSGRAFPFAKTGAAEHRFALAWLERNSGRGSALRARNPCFDTLPEPSTSLLFALATMLGNVRESFFSEEFLFSSREYEHPTTVHTPYISVNKVHLPPTLDVFEQGN